jgi:uncharacterized membrane protein
LVFGFALNETGRIGSNSIMFFVSSGYTLEAAESVPEPTTATLILIGLVGLAVAAARSKDHQWKTKYVRRWKSSRECRRRQVKVR